MAKSKENVNENKHKKSLKITRRVRYNGIIKKEDQRRGAAGPLWLRRCSGGISPTKMQVGAGRLKLKPIEAIHDVGDFASGGADACAVQKLGGFLLPVLAPLDSRDGFIEILRISQQIKNLKPLGLEQCRLELFKLVAGHAVALLHGVHLLQWFVAGTVALTTAKAYTARR